MDPEVALANALRGDSDSREAYNAWVEHGGFRARVKIHPATNAWMKGERYGMVNWVGLSSAHVWCERSGTMRKILLEDLALVDHDWCDRY